MESVIYHDSPLAELLEGEGKAEPAWASAQDETSSESSHSPHHANFAPRGPSTLHERIRDKLPQPLRIPLANEGPVAKLHSACSRAVNSRLGRADNERFLEHFRYIVVASHLLNEHIGPGGTKPPRTEFDHTSPRSENNGTPTTVGGAVVTGAAAFALVWIISWAKGSKSGPLINKGRLLIVFVLLLAASAVTYVHSRRQSLKNLRHEAVEAVTVLIANLKALDASNSTALTFIQEVELISRGYRISSPLPPITRLEDKGQDRRCSRLRRNARMAFVRLIPLFSGQCRELQDLVDKDDLEKYLDVYEISNTDAREALAEFPEESALEDLESLRALRVLQHRLDILRRIFLCSLLALEATGGKPDFKRWSLAIQAIKWVTIMSGQWSEETNSILGEEEQFSFPSPKAVTYAPEKERVRVQLRKLGALSQGIRGLQARMQILREESNKSLEESEDVTELGASLMAQYDSIGTDLKGLVQAWESGKAALAVNINRQERRISQASMDIRSPVPSLSGLTAVGEGDVADALRALNGEVPPLSAPPSMSGSNSDEEVYEAIALPRQRPRLSPEQRKAKIQEDQARQKYFREQREASTNMLKELESVINLRTKPNQHNRITSI